MCIVCPLRNRATGQKTKYVFGAALKKCCHFLIYSDCPQCLPSVVWSSVCAMFTLPVFLVGEYYNAVVNLNRHGLYLHIYITQRLFSLCFQMMCEDCCDNLQMWIAKRRGGEEWIPVVFIDKNTLTEEARESSCDDTVVLDVEGREHVEGAGPKGRDKDSDDNSVIMIPLSQLRRLQEELDPPPTEHRVLCLCVIDHKLRSFYTVPIDADSPLLPSAAVLVDANKPRSTCLWAERHHLFCVENIVWPRERHPHSGPLW